MHMASTNVNLNAEAYRALQKAKKKGQSFSEVVLRYVKPKPRTCGELLDELEREFDGVRIFDPELIRHVKSGRGRRSNRSAPKRK